jgi:hypothetical protein
MVHRGRIRAESKGSTSSKITFLVKGMTCPRLPRLVVIALVVFIFILSLTLVFEETWFLSQKTPYVMIIVSTALDG